LKIYGIDSGRGEQKKKNYFQKKEIVMDLRPMFYWHLLKSDSINN
jgi:hypothetical protein